MSKRKGSRNEHKAMKILVAAGYHTTRAAGSFGLFDIVAINAQGIRLIQVKTNRDASPVEREAIQLLDTAGERDERDLGVSRLRQAACDQDDWVSFSLPKIPS